MRNTILGAILLLISFQGIFAQNATDALILSQNFNFGTARYTAMGGAFSSLGGDASAINVNPAGLGIYKRSEVVATLNWGFISTETDFPIGNTVTPDASGTFALSNFGLIGAYENLGDWKYINAAFTINKKNSFKNRFSATGVNTISSMTDNFLDRIVDNKATNLNRFYEDLAWKTYLVDSATINGNLVYYTDIRDGGYGETQHKTKDISGGTTEYSIAVSGNYNDVVYLGMSIDIRSSRYNYTATYRESDPNDSIDFFNKFELNEELKLNANGVGMKLGAIIRPIAPLRIALAIHTPTYMEVNDSYGAALDNYFDVEVYGSDFYASHDKGIEGNTSVTDYAITTPFRAVAGASLLLGKFGIISADYEYVDYTQIKMTSLATNVDFQTENEYIRNEFQATGNLKFGAEARMGSFVFRAGYAMFGAPYRNQSEIKPRAATQFSAGAGINSSDFFIDLTWSKFSTAETEIFYQAYDEEPLAGAHVNISKSLANLTIGYKF
ncbi:MAG TPA: hypothetical protein DCQ31_00795 [Bacteroidales bacterium]|nr:hypothetical protein [Bacteroidales bacterium]